MRGRIDLVMRQEHLAGEKLFVDYAGMTMGIDDSETGEQNGSNCKSRAILAAICIDNSCHICKCNILVKKMGTNTLSGVRS